MIKAKQILDFDNWLLLKFGVTGKYWLESVSRFLYANETQNILETCLGTRWTVQTCGYCG